MKRKIYYVGVAYQWYTYIVSICTKDEKPYDVSFALICWILNEWKKNPIYTLYGIFYICKIDFMCVAIKSTWYRQQQITIRF